MNTPYREAKVCEKCAARASGGEVGVQQRLGYRRGWAEGE